MAHKRQQPVVFRRHPLLGLALPDQLVLPSLGSEASPSQPNRDAVVVSKTSHPGLGVGTVPGRQFTLG